MADLPLAFVAGNPTEGEVGVLMPSSPLREPIATMLLPDPYMLTSLASTITAPHRHHAHPEQEEPLSPKPSPPTTPLRFLFSGYSLWLELKQNKFQNDGKGDLSRMVEDAALRFNTLPIPYPHVTALYGIDLEEGEVRRIFREDVKRVLEDKARERRRSVNVCNVDDNEKMWPDLEALGILVDVEYDGVGNGTMDMAWAEVTFATSSEHEALIDALYNLFCKPRNIGDIVPVRSLPWAPHLSLCYDNPEGFPHNLSRTSITAFINEQAPCLEGAVGDLEPVNFGREVCGISLWCTKGTMSQWKCLDRIDF